jgi:[ribosomal protein S5]-alanine N-acetyltransferase
MDLVSERLSYHKFNMADIDDYMRWYTNDDVMKHITGRGLTKSEAEARFKIALSINEQQADAGFYRVGKRGANDFVGVSKFVFTEPHEAEVGYGMLPMYWGKGYASEMLDCMVRHVRRHHRITKLVAVVNPENARSVKVLVKKGFVFYNEVVEDNTIVHHYKLSVYQTHP